MHRPRYVVITGTIRPPEGVKVDSPIPSTREREYLDALAFYAGLPDELVRGVLFLENSDADLTPLRERCVELASRKEFVFLSTSSDYPPERGKRYGEFMMLDSGLQRLRALGLPGDTEVWKVGGRLKVRNLARMMAEAPAAFDLYADFRNLPWLSFVPRSRWLDLRLLAFTLDGYDRHLRGHFEDDHVLERAFFERLLPAAQAKASGIVPRFRTQPRFDSFEADPHPNPMGRRARTKSSVRGWLRQWLPGWWV
jgi:hypothetical protein